MYQLGLTADKAHLPVGPRPSSDRQSAGFGSRRSSCKEASWRGYGIKWVPVGSLSSHHLFDPWDPCSGWCQTSRKQEERGRT